MRSLKNRQGTRGLALIEMTLVLPLLLWLTFGVIEYGWMFLKLQQITSASREGVRVAVTPDATSGDVTSAISAVMTASGINSYPAPSVSPGVGASTGTAITVTVTVPYANLRLIAAPFLPTPTNLVASTAMAKEGP